MKQIPFTPEEKELLFEHLSTYLKEIEEVSYPPDSYRKTQQKDTGYIKRIKSMLARLSEQKITGFTPNERRMLSGCISNYQDSLRQQISPDSTLFWLMISDSQRELIAKLDRCMNIQKQCLIGSKKGFFYAYSDPDFRFGKVLEAADKLKKCDQVLLAKASGDYYKIGFAEENGEAYITFKFGDKMSREILYFKPTNTKSLEEIRKEKFDVLTTKEKAKELLSSHQRSGYEKDCFEVVDLLLK